MLSLYCLQLLGKNDSKYFCGHIFDDGGGGVVIIRRWSNIVYTFYTHVLCLLG